MKWRGAGPVKCVAIHIYGNGLRPLRGDVGRGIKRDEGRDGAAIDGLQGGVEIIQMDVLDRRGAVRAQKHKLPAHRVIHRPRDVAQILADQRRGFVQENAADGRTTSKRITKNAHLI